MTRVTADRGMSRTIGENKVLIATLGGVELVLSAMRHHPSHTSIQESGLGALGSLSVNGSCVCVCVWVGGGWGVFDSQMNGRLSIN